MAERDSFSQESGLHAAFHKKCAEWMLRTMDPEYTDDSRFFACAGWCMGGVRNLSAELLQRIEPPRGRTRKAASIREWRNKLAAAPARRADDLLENMAEEDGDLRDAMRDVIIDILQNIADSDAPDVTEFTGKIGKIFGLDADALELCAFAFCMENYDLPQNYFEDALELQNFENTRLMAKALSVSPYRYRQVESALIKMNILHTGRYRDAPRLIDSIEEAIRDVANKNLLPFFCQPLRRSTVSMDQFRLEEEDKRHVVRLLGARNGNPLHILLYGAPGSGKTSFASTLAQSLGLQAWAVPCREKDSTADRRVSLAACLRLAARHPRSFVLVDEAEKLLDTYSFKEGSSKAWLNDLLETRGARVIWISNEVSQLDHAVRRRFSYSLFFGDPGPVERERMWDMVAKKLRVTSRLPEETRKRFAEKYPVPVATIESATRQAKSLNVGREFSDYVERCLKSQMILRNDGHWSAPSILIEGNYDPEAATTKIPLEEIVRKTRALAKRLEAGDAPMACGGTMLLWGPPGTGKTAFGKYLAKTLGYQCLNYRASDLLGPYVGQTEQRIAEAFEAAKNERTMLLFDEVDSFLFGRENAQRSWEQTMVNEFLTRLEECRGLCVCSTNFRCALDSAAMRRFAYKVEFGYAKPEQTKLLYDKLLAPLTEQSLDEELERKLRSQKFLTPGDFSAVRSRFWMESPGDVTPEALVDALIDEERLKLDAGRAALGF